MRRVVSIQTGTFDVWTIGFHAYVGATVVAMRAEARCSDRHDKRQSMVRTTEEDCRKLPASQSREGK